MKWNYALFVLLLSTCSLIFLTSAAVVPEATYEAPPVEKMTQSKKELRQQQQKKIKIARLNKRLQRATSAKHKMRIQHKIDQQQQQQDAGVVLGIIALIFAFVFAPLGLILAIIARNDGGGFIANLAFWISLILIVAAVVLLVLTLLGTINLFGA